MTTEQYVPAVGTSGYFELLPPFDTQITTNERYTLKSVRTISDYIAANEDVRTLVYTQNNIDSVYPTDLQNDVMILGIQSERGHWIYVPAEYVKAYPVLNGIPYRTMSLVLPLQPIPADTVLTDVITQLSDVIMANLGFAVTVKVVETSRVVLIPSSQDLAVKVQRTTGKQPTQAEQIATLNNQLETALAKVSALENYILELPP